MRTLSKFWPAMPKSANPLRIDVQSANPIEFLVQLCPKVRTLCKFPPKLRTLGCVWRAFAQKCEPFAECAQKFEPFANVRQKCEPFRSFDEHVPKSANPLRISAKSANPPEFWQRCAQLLQTSNPFPKIRTKRAPPHDRPKKVIFTITFIQK